MSSLLAWALLGLCTAAAALLTAALYWATSAPRRRALGAGAARPRVTVLKPLCGADESLEENLATFFALEYPGFELLFGVEGRGDPALAVVERLRARWPGVASRVVVHGGGRGLNPKVSNLRAMLAAGTHDIVVVSDSNVAVAPDYLERMVAELERPGVGLVTSPIACVGARSAGAVLEGLHLNGYVAGAVAASQAVGKTVCVGKSMMFRRSVLDGLGGLESVATLLAEDYVLGRMFQEAGFEVRLCAAPIRNVSVRTTVRAFLDRQRRWGLIRSRLQPIGYLLEPLLNAAAVAALAVVFGAPAAAVLAWALAVTMLRDGAAWARMAGRHGLASAVLLAPVKELLVLGVWAVAPLGRHVRWRGNRLRVSAGTRLYAETPGLMRAA